MNDDQFMDDMRRFRAEIETRSVAVGPTLSVPLEPGHYVYVHHDALGIPLYVGYTKDPLQRVANHVSQRRRRSNWLHLVHAISWERYSTFGDASVREFDLINELNPPHNVAGNLNRRHRTTHMRLEVDEHVLADIARMIGCGTPLADLCDALEAA